MRHVYEPLMTAVKEWVSKHLYNRKYPSALWKTSRHFEREVRETLLGGYLGREYAKYFQGKNKAELEELTQSFKIGNCKIRENMNRVLITSAAVTK